MSRWRIVVVAALLILPFAMLAGVGSYHLWTTRWGFWSWWFVAGCMALGYLLGWYWQHKRQLLHFPDFGPPHHWTERDATAWKLVEARAEAGTALDPDKLTDLAHYLTV